MRNSVSSVDVSYFSSVCEASSLAQACTLMS